jgi:decaprenyl-phosphate phosphoribosyltransferase
MMKKYMILIRPQQYLKNLLIFFPIFFNLQLNDPALLYRNFLAFIAFSLAASSVYIFNDYQDITEDRRHPVKKARPLAAGEVSRIIAVVLMLFLAFSGLSVAVFFTGANVCFLILCYLALNVIYSLKLKHIAIIDVVILAAGFLIRIFVGGAVSQIKLSMWIILMTILLSLFLALAKRRDDYLLYLSSGEKARKAVDGYSLELLNALMVMMVPVIIVVYIMYTISPEIIAKAHTDKVYLTVIFVIVGLIKYLQISFIDGKAGCPTEVICHNRFMQLIVLGWLVTFGALLYY